MSRSRAVVLIGVLLVLPAAARAEGAAPSAPSEQGRAEGKARYERGVEAYSSGRFKDAIDLFLQADALAPSAALSFNIARAYERIGDDAAALQWYRDFRRRAPSAKNAAEVDARIGALEAQLAKKGVQQVTVLSEPPGATVVVDDKPLGVTPFTGQLTPGPHRLVLTLKGYKEAERELSLSAEHAQDVTVPLEPSAQASAPAAATAPPASATAPGPHRAGPRFGIWPWVTVGVGGAALGGALAFELARRSAEDAAKSEPTQVGYKEQLDSEQSRQTTARVLLGAGAALAVTGGVLLAIDWSSRSSRAARPSARAKWGAWCLPGGCAFDVRAEF